MEGVACRPGTIELGTRPVNVSKERPGSGKMLKMFYTDLSLIGRLNKLMRLNEYIYIFLSFRFLVKNNIYSFYIYK